MRNRRSATLTVLTFIAATSCGGVATTSVGDGGTHSGGAPASGASNGGVSTNAGGMTGSSGFSGGAAVGGGECAGVRCSAPQCPPSQAPYTPPSACCPVGCGPASCSDLESQYQTFRATALPPAYLACTFDADCALVPYVNPCDPTSCTFASNAAHTKDVANLLDSDAAELGCATVCSSGSTSCPGSKTASCIDSQCIVNAVSTGGKGFGDPGTGGAPADASACGPCASPCPPGEKGFYSGICCPTGCAPSACVDERTRYLAFRQSLLARSDIRCKQDTDCQAIAYANPCDPTSCTLVVSSGVIPNVIVDLDNYAAQNDCSQACQGVPVATCGAPSGQSLCAADGVCTVMSASFP